MLKTMIFIDYENFDISRKKYYNNEFNAKPPKIDFHKFAKLLIDKINNNLELVKVLVFAPKPVTKLQAIPYYANRYKWLTSLNEEEYITLVEGTHRVKPTYGYTKDTIDIHNRRTYTIEEKGTDVNLATHLATKGFMNAYDVAIVISGDTDYLPIISILNTIGKIVIVVGIKNQKLDAFYGCTDKQMWLDRDFFNECLAENVTDDLNDDIIEGNADCIDQEEETDENVSGTELKDKAKTED